MTYLVKRPVSGQGGSVDWVAGTSYQRLLVRSPLLPCGLFGQQTEMLRLVITKNGIVSIVTWNARKLS